MNYSNRIEDAFTALQILSTNDFIGLLEDVQKILDDNNVSPNNLIGEYFLKFNLFEM